MKHTFNSKRLLKIFSYVSAFLLVSFFIGVASIAITKTNTSIEYTMFYITHELKYYLPDGALKNEYSIGLPFNYTKDGNYKNQGQGWNNATADGSSMYGKQSDLYFYVGEGTNDSIQLSISLNTAKSYDNKLFINDSDTGCVFSFLSKSEVVSFPSSFLVKNSVNKLSLVRNDHISNFFVEEVFLYD